MRKLSIYGALAVAIATVVGIAVEHPAVTANKPSPQIMRHGDPIPPCAPCKPPTGGNGGKVSR